MKRQLQRILCYQCGSNHEVMHDFNNDQYICYPCIQIEREEEEEYQNETQSQYDKDLQREEEIYRLGKD